MEKIDPSKKKKIVLEVANEAKNNDFFVHDSDHWKSVRTICW